jgi:hypothetical protein
MDRSKPDGWRTLSRDARAERARYHAIVMGRLALLLSIAACGRLRFDVRELGGDGAVDAPGDSGPACSYGPWSTPLLVAGIESSSNDWDPAIHPDGQTLVFASDRVGGINTNKLFISTRQGGSWSAPTAITALNAANASGADWNDAGDVLYFVSDQSGGSLGYTSAYAGGVFGPPALIPGLESVEMFGPAISHDERELFFTTLLPTQIMEASRASAAASWGNVHTVSELDAGPSDGWPTLSRDGLTIYFESTRTGNGDIYMASRSALGQPFAAPTLVSELSEGPSDTDGDPDLSRDGLTIYMSSTRPTGVGANDMYVATRMCN